MVGAAGVYAGGGVVVVMDPALLVYLKTCYPGSAPDRMTKKNAEAVAIMARAIAPKRSGALASTVQVSQNRDEHGRFAFGYAVSAIPVRVLAKTSIRPVRSKCGISTRRCVAVSPPFFCALPSVKSR